MDFPYFLILRPRNFKENPSCLGFCDKFSLFPYFGGSVLFKETLSLRELFFEDGSKALSLRELFFEDGSKALSVRDLFFEDGFSLFPYLAAHKF